MTHSQTLRLFIPPIFLTVYWQLRYGKPESKIPHKGVAEWEYVPEGWAYAETHPAVKGWNVQDILETYKRKWPKFVKMIEGSSALGIAHESELANNADLSAHNTMMAFGYALALASHKYDTLSFLDWGGGIGHYFVLAKALVPGVEIEYYCKDVPLLASYGAQLFPQAHFYSDDSCLAASYDLVMASASLHYAEDWRGLVTRLGRATRRFLYIANLPTILKSPSFVFVQRPYAYGYNTEYLGWCLNRQEIIEHIEGQGLELVREFVYGHKPVILNAPEQNEYRGYLFRPSPSTRVAAA